MSQFLDRRVARMALLLATSALLSTLDGCAVDAGPAVGVGYGVDYYEPCCAAYGGWEPGYYVGPYYGGGWRGGAGPHPYRGPAEGHGPPGIPSAPHGSVSGPRGGGHEGGGQRR